MYAFVEITFIKKGRGQKPMKNVVETRYGLVLIISLNIYFIRKEVIKENLPKLVRVANEGWS